MTMIIHHDISLPDAHKRYITVVRRSNMWAWIILSILLHIGLLVVLSKFSHTPQTPLLNTPPILNATLIIPLTPKPSPEHSPPQKPLKAPLTIESAAPLPAAINDERPILEPIEDAAVETPTAIDTPDVSFKNNEPVQTEIMTSQAKIEFQQAQRQALSQYFNQRSDQQLNELSQAQANTYAKEQISPRLFQGTAPLSTPMQDAKIIYDAKIDVDCAKGINQVLATISQFTLHAVVCQQKGNIDPFIQQRLQKVSPQARSNALLPPKRRETKP